MTGGDLYRPAKAGPDVPERVLGYEVVGEELVRLATPDGEILYRAEARDGL